MSEQPVEEMNHATWIAGQLAHSFEAMGGELGLEPWLPSSGAGGLQSLFSPLRQQRL
jgi:hypothetical protein